MVNVLFFFSSIISGMLLLSTTTMMTTTTGVAVVSSDSQDFYEIDEIEYEIGYSMTIYAKRPPLFSVQSPYQKIEIYDSGHFGKILVIDDCVQLVERDANSYNEMLAHIPLMEFEDSPKRVLVIGGGDGYVINEVLKHRSVIRVDHVELDERVISVSKTAFSWGSAWDDPRVTLHIVDGAAFVRSSPDFYYDVIIQDSSDPFVMEEDGTRVDLPSEVLYTPQHFQQLYRILSRNGVFSLQAEGYNIPSNLAGIREWRSNLLRTGFQSVRYGTIAIATYPTGQIGFYVCHKRSKSSNNENEKEKLQKVQKRYDELSGETTYYHPRMQITTFDLPKWVDKYVYEDPKQCNSEWNKTNVQ